MVIWKNYVSEEAMYHCCSFVTSCASIVLYPFHIFNSLYLSKAYSCDNLSFFITSFALFFLMNCLAQIMNWFASLELFGNRKN